MLLPNWLPLSTKTAAATSWPTGFYSAAVIATLTGTAMVLSHSLDYFLKAPTWEDHHR